MQQVHNIGDAPESLGEKAERLNESIGEFLKGSGRFIKKWRYLFIVAAVVVIAAAVVVPRIISGTTKTVEATKETVAKATDPYKGMDNEKIFATLVDGGDKLGISTMTPLEIKMLEEITSETEAEGNIALAKIVDANKFVRTIKRTGSDRIFDQVFWIILYKDTSGNLMQAITLQEEYNTDDFGLFGFSGAKISSEKMDLYKLPSDGNFNSRTN